MFPRIDVECKMENKDSYVGHLIDHAPLYEGFMRAGRFASSIPPHDADAENDGDIDDLMDGDISNVATFIFNANNNLVAPTVLFNWSLVRRNTKNDADATSYLNHRMHDLKRASAKLGWLVKDDAYVVKGCNSTRSNLMKRCTTAEQIYNIVEGVMEHGSDTVRI